jgi:hypothetical protein
MTDDQDPSMAALQKFVAALSSDAARIRRRDPDADLVGVIAESGTGECRRARTLVAQRTGKEFGAENFAGIVPPEILPQILDATFPADALRWVMSRDQKREFPIIICAKNDVRVASVAMPEGPAAADAD